MLADWSCLHDKGPHVDAVTRELLVDLFTMTGARSFMCPEGRVRDVMSSIIRPVGGRGVC